MTKIFGHRGFSGRYPENTMLAFQKVAEETLADGIELDVQLTKDGEVVIMHDERLDRTTNACGYLKDYTLAELKELSVGVNFKGFIPRQTIPTLREYLAWLKTTNLVTDIELKTSIIEYEGIEKKVVDLVHEFGLEDRINYSSFNHFTCQRIKELDPKAEIGLLTDTWLCNCADYAVSQHATTVNGSTYFCSKPGIADELHAVGVKMMAWTPNTREELQALIDNHVDVLITNYPDLAAEVLGRHNG